MSSQPQSRKKRGKGANLPPQEGDKPAHIKKRRVDVYPPTLKVKGEWVAYAMKKRSGVKRRKDKDGKEIVPRGLLSSLIVDIVNKAIADDEDENKTTTREDLIKENEVLMAGNKELKEDLRDAKELAHRYDEELKGYRSTLTAVPLPLPRPDGEFAYDERLIQVLKKAFPKPVSYRFLERFYDDENGADFMFRQLASLETLGAIRDTGEGYVCVPEIDSILPKPGSVLRTRKVLFRRLPNGDWEVIPKKKGDVE